MSKTDTTPRPEVLSIAWHVQCHKNQKVSLTRKRDEMNRLYAEIERSEAELQFYTMQINEAVARGMKKFDPAKLLSRRKKAA